MAKVNSHSITKLGAENKILADNNQVAIAALKADNTDRKNEMSNFESSEKIADSKIDTTLGI